MIPEKRRRRIAQLVREAGGVTIALLEAEFGISPMTARRDLIVLEEEGRVRRTHGGAVLPEYAGHEDSFWYRLDKAVEAKERLAEAAVGLLEPGDSVFLDCSTTTYYLARRILREGPQVTLLTNSVPVMELFMKNEAPKTGVVGVGGFMRKLTLSFVGPHAVATISAHSTDKAFVSVKGVTREGFLTDPDVLEAEVKHAMIEHSEDPILLVDGSKFERRGLSVITHASKLSRALVVDAPEERLESLTIAEVDVRRVQEKAMSEGAYVWLIPDGFIPEESSGSQESHEAICVLNASAEKARLSISFYFEDREPLKDLMATVPPERTRHIRTDQLGRAEIPRGVPYAIRVESSIPVVIQCSRMDTTQAALSLMTTIAHPVRP